MAKNHIDSILKKYIEGTATAEESRRVETHYIHFLDKEGEIADERQISRATGNLRNTIQQQTNVNLTDVLSKQKVVPIWLRYAAAILLFLFAGGGFYWVYLAPAPSRIANMKPQDIKPGGNRATLTIAGGETIQLSAKHTEIITTEELKYDDGASVLSHSLSETNATPLTLSTPNGGTYKVTLPDGSKVWLNAASTLKYPSNFAADQRVVELTGEAYFSVRKDPKRPFRVINHSQQVEVLGTEFNISAYGDEPIIKSTLVEGSVRVSVDGRRSSAFILQPGQQARLHGASMHIRKVDVSNVIAWKSGRFSFEGKSFEQVMRELARWYDIKVVYEGEIPTIEFYGGAFRNRNLSTVLRLLESAGLNYHIRDRTLVVSTKPVKRKEAANQ